LEIAGAYLHPRNHIYGSHGVYLTEHTDRFEHYIRQLSSSFEKVVRFKPDGKWLYKKPLLNAWEINVESIQAKNPTAIRLLSVFGMFGTDALGLDVLEPLTQFEPSFDATGQGK
jgi:hypothetical protein